jgi:hypothetical protein
MGFNSGFKVLIKELYYDARPTKSQYLMMVVYKAAETCSECNAYVIFVVLWYSDPVVDMNFRIICDL